MHRNGDLGVKPDSDGWSFEDAEAARWLGNWRPQAGPQTLDTYALKGRGPTNRGRAKRARPASQGAPEPNWDDLPDGHAAGDAPATSVPRPRPRRRCVRSPHRDRDADAALGHAIALSYAQGPGAWGANHIIMPDGARFSMLEADPMKLTYY